MDPEFVLKV